MEVQIDRGVVHFVKSYFQTYAQTFEHLLQSPEYLCIFHSPISPAVNITFNKGKYIKEHTVTIVIIKDIE